MGRTWGADNRTLFRTCHFRNGCQSATSSHSPGQQFSITSDPTPPQRRLVQRRSPQGETQLHDSSNACLARQCRMPWYVRGYQHRLALRRHGYRDSGCETKDGTTRISTSRRTVREKKDSRFRVRCGQFLFCVWTHRVTPCDERYVRDDRGCRRQSSGRRSVRAT